MARVRKNIFEEFETVKSLIKEKLPEFDVRKLCVILGRLGTTTTTKEQNVVRKRQKALQFVNRKFLQSLYGLQMGFA